jgi:hypothetical protein
MYTTFHPTDACPLPTHVFKVCVQFCIPLSALNIHAFRYVPSTPIPTICGIVVLIPAQRNRYFLTHAARLPRWVTSFTCLLGGFIFYAFFFSLS